MKINGLEVNTDNISNGIYAMIQEQGEEAIVAFGMIPKWAIDTLEKGLRQKIIEIHAAQVMGELFTEEAIGKLSPFVSEQRMRETIQPIVREVVLGIYSAAARAGKMRV